MLIGIAVAVLVIALLFIWVFVPEQTGDHSVGWHSAHGTHRVLYPDGQLSQPFSQKVAQDYQQLFGGKVVPK